jgi:hypothetical protein
MALTILPLSLDDMILSPAGADAACMVRQDEAIGWIPKDLLLNRALLPIDV